MTKKSITTKRGNKLDMDIHGYHIAATLHHPEHGEIKMGDASVEAGQLAGWCKIKDEERYAKLDIDADDAQAIIAAQTAEKAAEKEAFSAAVPGYAELTNIVGAEESDWAINRQSIEDGEVLVFKKVTTADDVAKAKAQYPIAAAYILAETYEQSSNWQKSVAGARAKKAVENGVDYKKAIENMEKEWSEAARRSID